jgi:adenylate cyclase
MPIEIERRFLICSDLWRVAVLHSCRYRQGFLSRTSENSVRVRRSDDDATITVKGPRQGFTREEFEYPIPMADAEHMLRRRCVTPIMTKVRHWVEYAGMTWEVDVFRGKASGLVLAEMELDHVDQSFVLPPWIGAEVTHDLRYRSAGIEQGLWRLADVRDLTRSGPAAPIRQAGAFGSAGEGDLGLSL